MKAYDGKSDWHCFSFKFAELAHQEKWTSAMKKKNLFYFLEEGALKYAIRNENASYKSLMRKLEARYDKTLDADTAQMEYQNMRQKDDEELGEFYDRVQSRARDAFPESKTKYLEKSMIATFLKGLKDHNSGFAIKEYKKPKTIHEAFRLAKEHIAAKASFTGSSRQFRHCSTVPVNDEIDELRARMGRVMDPPSHPSNGSVTPTRKPRCYNCGDEGHYSPECHKPRQNRSQSRPQDRPTSPFNGNCYHCGKTGHRRAECRSTTPICRGCNKPGHTHSSCPDTICRGCNNHGHIQQNCPARSPIYTGPRTSNNAQNSSSNNQTYTPERRDVYGNGLGYHYRDARTPSVGATPPRTNQGTQGQSTC